MSAQKVRFSLGAVAAMALMVFAAACSGDGAADESDGTASTSEPASSPPSQVPGGTYVIESGDAVSAIADRYCVSAAALAEANDWGDGVNHVIQPGDAIALPADSCEPSVGDDDDADDRSPATTRRPSAATTAPGAAGPTTTVNEYIESYRADGGVPLIPQLAGDPDLYENADPLCEEAYYEVMSFERGLSDVDDLVADMDAVGVTPTADQLRYMQDWQEWTDTYLDGYEAIVTGLVDLGDEVAVEAVLADPAFVEASDAAAEIAWPAEGLYGTVVDACAQRDSATATAP